MQHPTGAGWWVSAGLMLWLAFLVWADVLGAQVAIRQIRFLSAPRAPGIVTLSAVEHQDETARPHIQYTYAVAGRQYEGNYRGRVGGPVAGAQRVVDRWRVGQAIDVPYDRTDPSQSVLEAGIRGAELFAVLLLIPFHAVGLLGLRAVWGRRVNAERPLGGAPCWTDEDSRLHVRLASWSPVDAALAGTGVCALLVLIGVGVVAGQEPSRGTALAGLALVAVVSAWSYRRARRHQDSGRYDLTLDEAGQVVTLPRGQRQDRLSLAYSDLRAVAVEKIKTSDGDGGTVVRHHVLLIEREGEQPARHQVVAWSDRGCAERLAHELADKLHLECEIDSR